MAVLVGSNSTAADMDLEVESTLREQKGGA